MPEGNPAGYLNKKNRDKETEYQRSRFEEAATKAGVKEPRDLQGTKLVRHPRTGKLVHPNVVDQYWVRQGLK